MLKAIIIVIVIVFLCIPAQAEMFSTNQTVINIPIETHDKSGILSSEFKVNDGEWVSVLGKDGVSLTIPNKKTAIVYSVHSKIVDRAGNVTLQEIEFLYFPRFMGHKKMSVTFKPVEKSTGLIGLIEGWLK